MHPFKSSELSVLAYANNFTLWHYFTYGTTAEVTQEGYFAKARVLRKNDLIITNTSDGTVFLIVGENTSVTIK